MIALEELRDAAQKAFAADMLSPPRDASWQLVAEMGWLLIALPEDDGGLGLGRDAVATVLLEQGRVLSSAPLIPATLGLMAAAHAAELQDRAVWIERMAGGDYVPLNLLPGAIAMQDGALHGTVSGFFEADMAGHVLAGAGGAYRLIPTDAAGVSLVERPLWDQSRRVFDLVLDGYAHDPALTLAEGAEAKALHDVLSPLAMTMLAADSLGGANAALERTLEYLKMRKQFDRPLALFQALKHRVADLKVKLVGAEALLWSRATDPEAKVIDMGAMKAFATEAAFAVVEDMVQLHGGIGLTEEHECHRFLKRALLNQQLCANADHLYAAVGRAALML